MENEMKDLKPCPFCGNEAGLSVYNENELTYLKNSKKEKPLWGVCCNPRYCGCGASSGFWDTEYKAIKAWNKRAEKEPAPQAVGYGHDQY